MIRNSLIVFLFSLILISLTTMPVLADQASLKQCRKFTELKNGELPDVYNNALLWQVQKEGVEDSYVFGTIHVSDPRVLDLPGSVHNALNKSHTFIMELLPDTTDQAVLKEIMFYPEGKYLTDIVDEQFFNTTYQILSKYFYSTDTVSSMKPWAAYLTMNYPPNTTVYLDLLLLNLAKDQQKEVVGLETLEEQLSILNQLTEKDQLQLLLDAVCNYQDIEEGFNHMIELYLKRDLKGLFKFNNTTMLDEKLYRDLYDRILTHRNQTMSQRVTPYLTKGGIFIAVGAMHLAGEDGLLALLKQQGYKLNPLY